MEEERGKGRSGNGFSGRGASEEDQEVEGWGVEVWEGMESSCRVGRVEALPKTVDGF